MRYRDIIEAAPDAEANAQRTQHEKLAAANDKAAAASQTYQSTVKAAHDSAAAAKRKLSAPPKATKTSGTGEACRSPPPVDWIGRPRVQSGQSQVSMRLPNDSLPRCRISDTVMDQPPGVSFAYRRRIQDGIRYRDLTIRRD